MLQYFLGEISSFDEWCNSKMTQYALELLRTKSTMMLELSLTILLTDAPWIFKKQTSPYLLLTLHKVIFIFVSSCRKNTSANGVY